MIVPIVIPSNNANRRHYDRVVWSEEEDAQLQRMFPVEAPIVMKKQFGLTYEQIRTRARTLGLKSRKTLKWESLNRKFFAEITVASSYWAGFLMADGYIKKNGLWIGVGEKDKQHLNNFAICLGIPGAVRLYDSIAGGLVKGKRYTRAILDIGSVQLAEDIERNFKVCPRKTLQPYVPPETVSGDFARAFLAGLIDGDGFIGLYEQDRYIRFGFVGAREICEWGLEIVNQTLVRLGRKPSAHIRHYRPPQWEMRCTGRNAQIILNELAQLCGELLLQRKWKVLEKFNQNKKWLVDKTAA